MAAVSTMVAAAGMAAGAYSANKQAKAAKEANQAAIDAAKMDPRIESMLFGTEGKAGLLGQIAQQASMPQNQAVDIFGSKMSDYLKNWGADTFNNSQAAANRLMGSNYQAPTVDAAQINAPSQNELDLQRAYNQMIYGNPAENPYLQGALNKGINQARNAFGNMQEDLTNQFQRDIMGSIRGGAIQAGQYSGSRQGIAEGIAAGELAKQLARASSQFGQNITDTTLGAQAGAFESGQNRALNAMSGLGAQQYGVAQNQAQLQQQAALANQQAKLNAQELNSRNLATGIVSSRGLLGDAFGYAQNRDDQQLNRLGKITGLLQPYANKGTPNIQPVYNNTLGGAMGGAMAGLSMYNAFQKPQTQSTGMNIPPITGGFGLGGGAQNSAGSLSGSAGIQFDPFKV